MSFKKLIIVFDSLEKLTKIITEAIKMPYGIDNYKPL